MAILAGILFFASSAIAQAPPTGDLDAACAQAMNQPTPQAQQAACTAISSQLASQAPTGITLSCVWTGNSCVANIVVDDSIKNPGTESTDLKSACAKGGGTESVCDSITAGIAAAGSSPSGITIECVWNNTGASNPCSPRITLQTSTITSKMVGSFIKSMVFIQGGVATTSVRVLSDPFVPYVIHTVVDGSNLPGGIDSDTWMTVTAVKDVTPQTFDFDSINPSAMAEAEQQRLKNQFASSGNVEIGPGIGPDFTALKALQTFNWSMTISYDVSKEYVGTAQCNGTFNDTVNQCMDGDHTGDWLKLPECTNPASCPAGTYRKDFPSAGLLTIYNADPAPIYKSTGTTTTTTGSTTTTTAPGGCTLIGDDPPCGVIAISEILNLITSWASGGASITDVLSLISAWAAG